MKRIPAWLSYTLLRLAFILVPFFALWFLGFEPWMAAIFAAVIALSLSVIFLSRFRNATSESLAEARIKKPSRQSSDESVEDALDDENRN